MLRYGLVFESTVYLGRCLSRHTFIRPSHNRKDALNAEKISDDEAIFL